jgi:hypothetical protein
VRARCCGPFHWPRQYGNTDSAHGNSATGLQPSV